MAPELAFDQGPGDLFVVRIAGNFASNDGIASLEYAVQFLNVPLVMVLGHTNCGAVDATIKVLTDNTALPGRLPQLVASIRPAVALAQTQGPSNLLDHSIVENVRWNVSQLGNAEPILAMPPAAARSRRRRLRLADRQGQRRQSTLVSRFRRSYSRSTHIWNVGTKGTLATL